MWLRPIECRRIEGDRILLRAPNQYVRLWFESNYLPILLDELRVDSDRHYQVECEIAETSSRPVTVDGAGAGAGAAASSASEDGVVVQATEAEPPSAPHAAEYTPPTHLNGKYIFETFVAGPS